MNNIIEFESHNLLSKILSLDDVLKEVNMFEELLMSVGYLTVTNVVFSWRRGAESVKWVFWTIKSPIDTNAVISIQMQIKNISIKLKKRFRNCNNKKTPKTIAV